MRVDYSAPILIIDDEQVIVRLTKQVLGKVAFKHAPVIRREVLPKAPPRWLRSAKMKNAVVLPTNSGGPGRMR